MPLLVLLVCCSAAAQAQSSLPSSVCVPPPSGLVDWWPGDGNYNDIVGGNNGTPIRVTFAPGKVVRAFSFNGAGALELGSAGTIGTADFTFDFWLLSNASSITQGVLGKRPACGPGNFYDFRTLSAADFGGAYVGHLLVEVDGGSDADDNEVISSKVITDGVFHHIGIVRQATTVMVYIDGVLDSSGTGSGVADVTNSSVLTAGESACNGSNANAPLVGELDEIHLYNRALADSEIRAIYNAGNAGSCKGGLAVDVSASAGSTPPWSTMCTSGISYAVVETWSGTTAGSNTFASTQLSGAYNNGLGTAAYMVLNLGFNALKGGAQQAGTQQAQNALNLLGGVATNNLAFMAVDVEYVGNGCEKNPSSCYPQDPASIASRNTAISAAIQTIQTGGTSNTPIPNVLIYTLNPPGCPKAPPYPNICDSSEEFVGKLRFGQFAK